jgi:ferritin-like metal-binding protein YciE
MARPEVRLLQWLRDAHAMEEQAVTLLTGEARRMDKHPQLKAQIDRHLAETERQVEKLEGCIERHNGGASAVKDAMAKMTAFGQTMSGLFVGDEVVKVGLALYTFEHLEIASYRILVIAAEEAGDLETKRVCEEILREELAMAQWLEENIETITRGYLQREMEGAR